ncbi:hypothetical protein J4401_06415 [Candidatus Woesearchaeota archaeon]|nr:hypothetical protein [Candidatus Woesearchaeota archaeon]
MKTLLKTAFYDIIFMCLVGIIYFLWYLLNPYSYSNQIAYFILFFAYSSLLVISYSHAKCLILRGISHSKNVCTKKLAFFNLAALLIFIAVLSIGYYVLKILVMPEYLKLYFSIFFFSLLATGYIILHTSHVLIFLNKPIRFLTGIIRKNALKFIGLIIAEIMGLAIVYLIYVYLFNTIGGFVNVYFQAIGFVYVVILNSYNRLFTYRICGKFLEGKLFKNDKYSEP